MTRFISAADANRQFSEILGQAARGETVVITRRGLPVAQLTPFAAASEGTDSSAWDRLMTTLNTGVPLGGMRLERDDLYDR
jgi:prevent-host-death family protein